MVVVCPVLGCQSKSTDKSIKFFPFPRVSKKYGDMKRIWFEFTRRKNYVERDNEKICQYHFHNKAFFKQEKDGKMRIKRTWVPTIYYLNGERIEVPFNSQYQKYYGPEADRLYHETEDQAFDHESELIRNRYIKLRNLKNLCRFCFRNNKIAKCITIAALDKYQVDPVEFLDLIGCSTDHNETFSDIVCEECFIKIIELTKFAKNCSEQQKILLQELNDLDEQISKVQKVNRSKEAIPWFKVEITDQVGTSVYIDSSQFMNKSNDDDFYEGFDDLSIKKEPAEQKANDNSQVSDHEDYTDFEMVNYDTNTEDEADKSVNVDKLVENIDEDVKKEEEPIEIKSTKEPKRPLRNPPNKNGRRENYRDRQYECFFCRLKFRGKITYKKHECTVKARMCEAPGCGKTFTNQGSYGVHVTKIHGMPRIQRQYCPGCKIYYQMSAFDYKEHLRTCESSKTAPDNPIRCEILKCGKLCKNLETYTAHKLFHATENLVEFVDENGEKTYQKPKSAKVEETEKICDLCGKVLTNYKNLRKHKVNVHLVDFTGQMYYCDLCPVKKPTRRLIYDHMKSVHIVNWHTCAQCGKSFKSRRLLARHTLYMHERHRLNIRCQLCPDKPGFSATIYLEQHMKRNHGDNSARNLNRFKCDYGFCDATYAKQASLDQHKIKMHGYYYA